MRVDLHTVPPDPGLQLLHRLSKRSSVVSRVWPCTSSTFCTIIYPENTYLRRRVHHAECNGSRILICLEPIEEVFRGNPNLDLLRCLQETSRRLWSVTQFLQPVHCRKAIAGFIIIPLKGVTTLVYHKHIPRWLTRFLRSESTATGTTPTKLLGEGEDGADGPRGNTLRADSTKASSIGGEVSCLLKLLAATCNTFVETNLVSRTEDLLTYCLLSRFIKFWGHGNWGCRT